MRFWNASSESITLAIGDDGDRVVSINHVPGTDEFAIVERCDDYFSAKCSRDDLIAALEEAIAWARDQGSP